VTAGARPRMEGRRKAGVGLGRQATAYSNFARIAANE
jgi:hypothetical protein